MIKSHFFALGVLAWSISTMHGQNAEDNSRGGILVDCGAEKVAIFGGTTSKDGHYAVGWTLCPKPGKAPVDWTSYNSDQPQMILNKYPIDVDRTTQTEAGYAVLNGLLDLRLKTFTPLVTADPSFPYNRGTGLSVDWSTRGVGRPYAIISVTPRWETVNFWLVQIRGGTFQIADLKADVDKVLESYVHHLDPERSQDYALAYSADLGDARGKPHYITFRKNSVTIPFEAAFSHGWRSCVGKITLKLPDGSVTQVTPQRGQPPLIIDQN